MVCYTSGSRTVTTKIDGLFWK